MSSAAGAPAVIPEHELERGTSLWRDAWKRLKRNRMAMVSGAFLIYLVLVSFLAPPLVNFFIGPWSWQAQDLAYGARGPNWQHWFGTDPLGRDLLIRVLAGTQVSLAVGFAAGIVSLGIGTTWGAIAGYAPARVDNLMMRFVDVLYSLPYIFLVILLVTLFGSNVILLFVALGAWQSLV